MKRNQREKGAFWEQKAGEYLQSMGYEILEYNFRCRTGEIDIVARDGVYLVFCEVKYRGGTASGYPSEAVDHRKQKVISRCALYYLMKHGNTEIPCRFDVVSVLDGDVQIIKNAFDYTG